MNDLSGKNLINKKEDIIIGDEILKNLKIVVYLFCSQDGFDVDKLLKELKSINTESHRRNSGIEIVYVPLDHDPNIVKTLFKKHGNWFAVPVGNNLIGELIYKYGIIKDPTVLVVKKDGKVISWDADSEIKDIGLNVLITWSDY